MFYYSRDRRGEHPQAHLAGYAGILQADAYDGYNKLYLADRKPGPIREAACWVHARRPFFAMADIEENARRKAAGKEGDPAVADRDRGGAPHRRAVCDRAVDQRQEPRGASGGSTRRKAGPWSTISRPTCASRRRSCRAGTTSSRRSNYMLKRWPAFTLFLDDGRVCMSNNAAERGLRGVALGRKSWLFCGSDRGGRRAAAMYSLIVHGPMPRAA